VTKPECLYHFTCKHSKRDIGTSNCLLRPMLDHPLLGCKVLWLTTQACPDRDSTGLTSNYQRCDRMEFRYVVTNLDDCRPWLDSPERAAVPAGVLDVLESFGDCEHWWIASKPIRARFDRAWSR